MLDASRLALVVASLLVTLAGCGGKTVPEPDASAPDGALDASARCTADDECDDGRFCNGAERCMPSSSAADDEGCVPAAPPCSTDECDEANDRCVVDCTDPDRDGDGVSSTACGGEDCDDDDANRFPGNPEVCDAAGHDEDCRSSTVGMVDADSDGAISAACCNPGDDGMRVCGTDCDDGNPAIRPGATEPCNGVDDDCDGAIDEMAQLTLWPDADHDGRGDASEDAVPMLACAESEGWVLLRGDCDDSEPGRHVGATEACNAIDDDCDGLVDDVNPGIVICSAGQSIACVNACGVAGSSTCRGDCLGYATCTASEQCNGCDDDANGAIDDGFECARGISETCTNACGVAGTRVCGTSCTWASACTASEACNYCDDDGNDGFLDERSLATTDSGVQRIDCSGTTSTYGTAQCQGAGISPLNVWVDLLDGSAVDTAGAMWFDPDWHTGWGRFRVEIAVEARTIGSGVPLGGWSLIIARGGSGTLGTPESRGVPSDIEGIAFDWYWSTFSIFSPYPSQNDSMRYRRLGSNSGPRGADTESDGQDIVGNDADLDSGSNSFVRQAIVIEYDPDDPRTPANEERVMFTANGLTRTYQVDLDFRSVDPANDMPIGSPIRIGLTAGTFSRTVMGTPFGAPVEARAALWTFYPPIGAPGNGTYINHATMSRAQICPEL